MSPDPATEDERENEIGNCPWCDAPLGVGMPGCVHWPTEPAPDERWVSVGPIEMHRDGDYVGHSHRLVLVADGPPGKCSECRRDQRAKEWIEANLDWIMERADSAFIADESEEEAEVKRMAPVVEAAERWDVWPGGKDLQTALSRALAVYHGADKREV